MKQILIAIDQLFNTLLNGWADETLSCRCWRRRHKRGWGLARVCVDTLFFWETDHCRKSYESEIFRMQCPPELRNSRTLT